MDKTEHMISDFNYIRSANPDLGKAVWHTSISFDHSDKVNDELMKRIAKDYADKFGLEQYAVIKHNDTKHAHFHIIGNRVKYNGKTVSDQYCAGRGVELSHRLEKKYGLAEARTKGKNLSQTNTDNLKGATQTKYEIYQAIEKELPNCKSIEDLQTKLKAQGIETELKKQSTGNVFGVSFKKGDECFKGSEIDKKFGINNIMKAIENKVTQAIQPTKIITNVIKRGLNFGM